jgi:E3 ubiquitin-protein ligase RNF144
MDSNEAAASAGGASHIPIYIVSDEDDERAAFDGSYSPDDVEVQEAILLSLNASCATTASSAHTDVSIVLETPPDCKGKRKQPWEGTHINSNPEFSILLSNVVDARCDTVILVFRRIVLIEPNVAEGPSNYRKKRSGSGRKHIDCAICFEKVQVAEKFLVSRCAHAFCNTCVGSYVAAKISENVAVIGCPDPECKKGLVQIDQCRSIIPSELFDRWNVALCEDVGGGDKLYCPFKDCSVLLSSDGAAEIRETECPQCHRLFCASCRVPWHHGIRCKEFQKLGDDERGQDDLTLRNLANEKWSRCPKCKMYVERIDGCVYIVCRYLLFHCFICSPNILLHREQLQWTSFFIKFSGAGTASATSADPR